MIERTELARVLEGFMEERGIKDAEELAAAMNARSPSRRFVADVVRAVLEDPARMDPEFVAAVGDALAPDRERRFELIRALLEAVCDDIRPGG